MKVISKNCEIKEFVIDSENINSFDVMENRRQIGENHVRNIHGVLLKGKNPIGVLIVNERNKKLRLIDGNHRIEAIKRFYGYKTIHRTFKFECVLKVYKNLDDDEEREVYSNEAKRRNESHEDRLNMYKDTIIFWKLTQNQLNKFPCKISIYNQKNSVRFRVILDSLSTVKSDSLSGYVPRYLSKEDLINFARELKHDDFLLMKKFINIFQKVFGDVGEGNNFCRRQGFVPLFDIFYKNFRAEKEERVVERFSCLMGKPDIMMYLSMQGREAQQMIRKIMLTYINKGRTKVVVV